MNITLNLAVRQISELQANMTLMNNTLNNISYNLSTYYVPYNNATHNVNLGNYNITTQSISTNDSNFTRANITTANITTATIINTTVTNLLGALQAVIGTMNATTANMDTGNIISVNSSAVNSINAVITTVNSTNAYFVTLNVSNIYTNWISANNANITSANITYLNSSNITAENITSTSMAATTGSFGNIYNKTEVYNKTEIDAMQGQKDTIGPYLYNNTTHYQFNETYLNNTIGNISEIKQFEEYVYIDTTGGSGSNISSVINYIIKEIRVMPSSNSSKYRFEATETTSGEPIDDDKKLHTGVWDIIKNHVIYNDSVSVNITNSNPSAESYIIKLTYLNNGLA
jgi:hypothetical protein